MSFDISKQYDRLYRYCYYHTHNRILSQDIVQEAFTRSLHRPFPQAKHNGREAITRSAL